VLLRTAGREDQGEWVYLVVLVAGEEPEEDLANWQRRSPRVVAERKGVALA